VESLQATDSALLIAAKDFRLEDNGEGSPLIIFYQRALPHKLFWRLQLVWVAGKLRRFLQAEQTKQRLLSNDFQN
jgi:hypothetical protein